MSRPAAALSQLLFWASLLGMAIWTVLQFLGAGAGGSFELWGVGRAMAAIELLMLLSLLLNARHLVRPSATTVAVLTWVPWVLVDAAMSVNGDIAQWVLAGAMPVLLWPVVYLFFYSQGKMGGRAVIAAERYFFVLGLACVALFAGVFRQVNADPVSGFQQLNAVYYALFTLPWMFLVRKPLWRGAGIIAIMMAVICSLKRTAIIAMGATGVVYLMVGMTMQARSFGLRRLVLLAALGCAAWFAYFKADGTIGIAVAERFREMTNDGGSGRVTIYSDVLEALKAADAEHLILGHGHYGSLERFGVTAHNDLLEVTFDYGLIGLAIYLWLHVCVIRKARALYRGRSQYAAAAVATYVLFLVVSMTSHLIIYPTYFAYLVAFWGAIEGATRQASGQRIAGIDRDRVLRGGSPA